MNDKEILQAIFIKAHVTPKIPIEDMLGNKTLLRGILLDSRFLKRFWSNDKFKDPKSKT